MNAASKNASRLTDDACLLLDAGRFPSAASLAILAIEEAGKVSILRGLSLARSDAEALEEWKAYRAHTGKNVSWILPELAANGARRLDDFKTIFDGDADHPHMLDQLKQLGFYTDCLGKAHWSLPWDVIDGELARHLVKIAQITANDSRVTPKEIELWIEHIGPVWKKDLSWMKQALVNWYAALQTHGLAPEGPNKMEEFVRGEGDASEV